MTASRVLIVGASLGGLRTAEQLRARKYTGEIVVVGDEPHHPYNRPPLSKELLTGQVEVDATALRSARDLEPITWMLGKAAVSADLSGRTVTLSDGTEIAYDILVVATGVRPRRLPALEHLDNVFTLRGLDDSMQLRQRLHEGIRVAVIGSGFIGCEVAASARKLGCDVSVVSRYALPLESALGTGLARRILERHLAAGVAFHLEDGIGSVESSDGVVTRIELASGDGIDVDLVVEAIGCIPNVEWLEGNGLDLREGLLCDDSMAVEGADGVYAIGDVARFPNDRFDTVPRRVEHWNIAIETARRAAAAITATDGAAPLPPFRPLPAFWSNQYEIRLQAYGLPRLADSIRDLDEELGGAPVSAYYRGDELVAVAALDNGPSLVGLAQQIGARPTAAAPAG